MALGALVTLVATRAGAQCAPAACTSPVEHAIGTAWERADRLSVVAAGRVIAVAWPASASRARVQLLRASDGEIIGAPIDAELPGARLLDAYALGEHVLLVGRAVCPDPNPHFHKCVYARSIGTHDRVLGSLVHGSTIEWPTGPVAIVGRRVVLAQENIYRTPGMTEIAIDATGVLSVRSLVATRLSDEGAPPRVLGLAVDERRAAALIVGDESPPYLLHHDGRTTAVRGLPRNLALGSTVASALVWRGDEVAASFTRGSRTRRFIIAADGTARADPSPAVTPSSLRAQATRDRIVVTRDASVLGELRAHVSAPSGGLPCACVPGAVFVGWLGRGREVRVARFACTAP